jgi:7-carboxy-7-deazaguanine synthase
MPLSLAVLQESSPERVKELKGLDAGVLLIHEVYASLQGEGTHVGLPCAFVRTTGCHLRCRYCDTAHAFHEGARRDVDEVVAEVLAFGLPLVLVTGGEPLLQRAAPALLRGLCAAGLVVLLETSGAVSTEAVDPRVRIILDIKTPGSGEVERNLWANLERLRPHDEVKLVVCDEGDYAFAKDLLKDRSLSERCAVLLSPEAEGMDPAWLAARIVEDRLPVRMQVQLHKVLWGTKRGV